MTIGIPGTRGFGVGVCQLADDILNRAGLQPLDGYNDTSNDNYGNYIHTNGSIMVWIPAFCYRIGNKNHPLYEKYGENLIEIADADKAGDDQWILHRAFVDGGKQKSGVFVDKYLSSKHSNNYEPISIKNGEIICMMYDYLSADHPNYNMSFDMINDDHQLWGHIGDALVLAKRRGKQYVCLSSFVWSAITMLALSHAQASTSTDVCAWYDPLGQLNWPKGNTSDGTCHDFRDTSVSFTPSKFNPCHSLTGSGMPFAKTTHNGQCCGIADVSGNAMQPTIGIGYSKQLQSYMVLKPTASIFDFVRNQPGSDDDVCSDLTMWDYVPWDITALDMSRVANKQVMTTDEKTNHVVRIGTKDNKGIFYINSTGPEYSCCGVIPCKDAYHITDGSNPDDEDIVMMFGTNAFKVQIDKDNLLYVGGYYNNSSRGGIFLRYISDKWTVPYQHCGMRVIGYIDE